MSVNAKVIRVDKVGNTRLTDSEEEDRYFFWNRDTGEITIRAAGQVMWFKSFDDMAFALGINKSSGAVFTPAYFAMLNGKLLDSDLIALYDDEKGTRRIRVEGYAYESEGKCNILERSYFDFKLDEFLQMAKGKSIDELDVHSQYIKDDVSLSDVLRYYEKIQCVVTWDDLPSIPNGVYALIPTRGGDSA